MHMLFNRYSSSQMEVNTGLGGFPFVSVEFLHQSSLLFPSSHKAPGAVLFEIVAAKSPARFWEATGAPIVAQLTGIRN
jgi:hypothetical protein